MTVLNKRGPGRPRNVELISQRRQDILDVSTQLFAARGYAGTDVQEIADELNVAKGTIYRYFPSKEKLFLASVDRSIEDLSKYIDESIAGIDDHIEQIARAIRAFLKFFDMHPEYVELIVQERAEFRDRKKPTYIEYRERNIEPWIDVFSKLSRSGRFRQMDADEMLQTIDNLMYGTIFTTYFARHGRSFESMAKQIILLVFAGILGEREKMKLDSYLQES